MAPLLHASSSPPGPGAHGGPGPSRGTLLRCRAAPSTPCPRNPLRLPASQGRVRSRTSPQSAQGPHPAHGLTHTSTLMSSNPVPRLPFPTRLAWGTPSLGTPAGRAKGCPRLAHSEAWLLRPPEPPLLRGLGMRASSTRALGLSGGQSCCSRGVSPWKAGTTQNTGTSAPGPLPGGGGPGTPRGPGHGMPAPSRPARLARGRADTTQGHIPPATGAETGSHAQDGPCPFGAGVDMPDWRVL